MERRIDNSPAGRAARYIALQGLKQIYEERLVQAIISGNRGKVFYYRLQLRYLEYRNE